MESEFEVPLHPADLLLRSADSIKYGVEEHSKLHLMPVKKAEQWLDDIVDSIHHNPFSIIEHSNFDPLFNFINQFAPIEPQLRNRVIDIVVSGTRMFASAWAEQADDDSSATNTKEARNALKLYVFLLYMICTVVESDLSAAATAMPTMTKRGRKKKKSTDNVEAWSWEVSRAGVLNSLALAASTDMRRLWSMGLPEDSVVGMFTKTAMLMLENPTHGKDKDCRAVIVDILATAVVKFKQEVWIQTAAINMLYKVEHAAEPLAELVVAIYTGDGSPEDASYRPANTAIVGDIIRELSKLDPADLAADTNGTRTLSNFLVAIGEKVPAAVLPYVSLLVAHLDGEAYAMRNGVVSVIGYIIAHGFPEPGSPNARDSDKATRASLFNILEDRFLDRSSYTRSRVLQTWAYIAENKALPIKRLQSVVKLVVRHLEDSASIVRRNALKTLAVMLQYNPYAGNLAIDDLQGLLATANASLAEAAPDCPLLSDGWNVDDAIAPPSEAAPVDGGSGVGTPEDEANSDTATETAKDSEDGGSENEDGSGSESEGEGEGVSDNTDADADTNTDADADPAANAVEGAEQPASDPVVDEAKFKVVFLRDAVSFAARVNAAIPLVCNLLGSKNVTDVLESIRFLVTAASFGVSAADAGIRKMLLLVFSKEQAVKDALLAAYSELYIAPGKGLRPAGRAALVAKNLIALTDGASLAELTSLEELISELRSAKLIDGRVGNVLWEIFAGEVANATAAQRAGALVILTMSANSDARVIKSNLSELIEQGLCLEAAVANPTVARYTFIALQKLAGSIELSDDHPAFAALLRIAVCKDIPSDAWYAVVEQAINALYLIASEPDTVCTALIQRLATAAVSNTDGVSSDDLSRLFFAAGHISLKHLVYLEERQRQASRARAAAEDAAPVKAKVSAADAEEEMGMGGGAAAIEDAEAEVLHEIIENDIVTKNLIGLVAPVIVAVCEQPAVFSDSALRLSAVLALSKLMCVSGSFCDGHLQLLFSVLEQSSEAAVRANVVISLGDLAFRFPNLVEPWTGRIYDRLADESTRVRKNTLMVLTHLILNDMVKVKGQIAAMAKCLQDPEPRIADLAALFFHELSLKNNAIYNILPDTLSHLSAEVSSDQFRAIMAYLFSFVKKDRQQEALVSKLCARFPATTDEVQWRNIAYCLSLLSYTDRSIKRLVEVFKTFQDKVVDDEVYEHFCTLISKTKKFAKADVRSAVEDLEAKIEAVRKGSQDGSGDEGAEGEDGGSKRRASARGGKKKKGAAAAKPARRSSRRKAAVSETSEDESLSLSESSEIEEFSVEDSSEGDSEKEQRDTNANGGRRSSGRRAANKKSMPLKVVQPKARGGKARAPAAKKKAPVRGRGGRRKAVESSESESIDLGYSSEGEELGLSSSYE